MSSGEAPLVTVVIPTYHQHQYLPTAILSVIAQSYPYVELIIVTVDGDEETDRVITQALSVFRQVRQLESEEAHHIHQINLGLKEAKGAFVTLMGSDDFMLPNKLSTEMGLAHANKALLVYSRFFITDEYLNIQTIPPIPTFSYLRLIQRNFIVDSCLVAKEMYQEFGLFDETLSSLAVYDKWLHIAEKHEDQIIYNPFPVILYRTHSEQKHHSRLLDPKQLDLYNQIVNASLKRKGINRTVEFQLTNVEVERV